MCWMGKNARFQIVPYSVQFGSVHVLFGLPTPVTRSEKKQRNFPKQKKNKINQRLNESEEKTLYFSRK